MRCDVARVHPPAVEVSSVCPRELDIVDKAQEGTLAVTLAQALTVGPQARIEFKRLDDGSDVDVQMARADYTALRDRLGLRTGSQVHLLPRRVTCFSAGPGRVPEDLLDPAAMI